MVLGLIQKGWLCLLCLSVVTVGWTGNSAHSHDRISDRPRNAQKAYVDRERLKLDQKVRVESQDTREGSVVLDETSEGQEFTIAELLKNMVSESDNTSTHVLLRLIGGSQVVNQYLQSLDVSDMVVVSTTKESAQSNVLQYQNYATLDEDDRWRHGCH